MDDDLRMRLRSFEEVEVDDEKSVLSDLVLRFHFDFLLLRERVAVREAYEPLDLFQNGSPRRLFVIELNTDVAPVFGPLPLRARRNLALSSYSETSDSVISATCWSVRLTPTSGGGIRAPFSAADREEDAMGVRSPSVEDA